MNIAIIGSGVGGLSSAVRLIKKGYSVSIFERNNTYGGKLGSLKLNKFSFDTGPSLLTMPHLIDELFSMHGEDPRNYFNYKRKISIVSTSGMTGQFLQHTQIRVNILMRQRQSYQLIKIIYFNISQSQKKNMI